MSRIIFFIFIGIVAFVFYLIKISIGKVSGNSTFSKTSFKNEASHAMDKTAKGINWMEKQWDEAKKKANNIK